MNNNNLRTWVEHERDYLWHLLADAYRAYLNTSWIGVPTRAWHEGNQEWSMGCEGLGQRIKSATALVGPVSPGDIGMSYLANGWFVWANQKLGIENALLPDDELVTRCREWVAGQHV